MQKRRGKIWLKCYHFLYTLSPDEPPACRPSAACFGGMHGACAVVQPLCPHCGDSLRKDDSFDLSQTESHCTRCDQTFLTSHFVKVTGPTTAILVLEGLEIDETSDHLEIRYYHPLNKTSFWGTIVAYAFLVLIMGIPCFFVKDDWEFMQTVTMAILIIGTLAGLGVFVYINEIRESLEWRWQMTIDPRQFELVLSWSNREKRITILREDILAVDWNENADMKAWRHTFFREKMPTSLQHPLRDGLHLDLRDGICIYLPTVSVPSSQHWHKQRNEIMAGTLFKIKSCRTPSEHVA